jgi:hypothetical protein
MALAFFGTVLVTTLILAAASEWQPRPKGNAMKALFAVVLAAMLAAMAIFAHAAPLPQSTDIQAPLPSDDDKDKEKDKKGD